MDYVMYCTAKNKLYSIYTDIKRGENKENVLVDILFRVEELDGNNEDTKILKELKNMYIYDPGLTDHQINDGVANMYATTIKVDADVEDEDEIKWHHMKSGAINELIKYVKESEEKVHEGEKKWPMIDDVILNDDVKHQITQVIKFIKDKDKYIKMGCRIPHGYLLCGHSGTGKTLIAKAIANECDVDIMQYSGSSFTEKYVGVGPKRIRDMFDEARKKKNCIIFLEELDALCAARNEDMNKEDLKTLTELLTQMDGFNDNTGIFIIGTTNQINLIDKAVLRPKRFDRIIKVEKPNEENRRKIFELYLGKMQCDETIDTEKYAIKTIGMNGAELENICNEAGILAVDRDKDKISDDEIMYMIKKTLEIDTTQNFLEDEMEEKHIGFI